MRPSGTWCSAWWCEWYIPTAGPTATKSYTKRCPGFTGSCVTNGTPSIALGTSMPWKWMAVDCGSLLSSTTRTWSPG